MICRHALKIRKQAKQVKYGKNCAKAEKGQKQLNDHLYDHSNEHQENNSEDHLNKLQMTICMNIIYKNIFLNIKLTFLENI